VIIFDENLVNIISLHKKMTDFRKKMTYFSNKNSKIGKIVISFQIDDNLKIVVLDLKLKFNLSNCQTLLQILIYFFIIQSSLQIGQSTCKLVIGLCYHSVNVITFVKAQSDHIKRRLL
jgi:hypothetical protein